METMERKKPRPRRSFTPEFKAEIVELCRARRSQTSAEVCQGLRSDRRPTCGTGSSQAEIDQGMNARGSPPRRRRSWPGCAGRTRSLKEDVEILKRATVFFAKETR